MSVEATKSQPAIAASATAPKQIQALNSEGDTALYFLKNNPWKLSEVNSFQKVYRFCLICGKDRFGNDRWNQVIDRMWAGSPLICEKIPCIEAYDRLSESLYCQHCIFRGEGENVAYARQHEQFEAVSDV